MDRLSNEVLEKAIGVYKTTIEAVKDINDEDYCSALDKATLSFLEELKAYRDAEEKGLLARSDNNGWISVDERYPENDRYVLLSFANFDALIIGRYEEDDEGGAFYAGDEEETLVS